MWWLPATNQITWAVLTTNIQTDGGYKLKLGEGFSSYLGIYANHADKTVMVTERISGVQLIGKMPMWGT